MKKLIRFSKFFFPAAVISAILIITGLAGYVAKGGFNLGVDFQAGLIQEIQLAPAFSITYSGLGTAVISFDRNSLYIVLSGAGVEARTLTFPLNEYGTVGSLARGLRSEGLDVKLDAPESSHCEFIVHAQGNPYLGNVPYVVHYYDPQRPEIKIETVREALNSLGQTVAVQSLGGPSHFMIRFEDKDSEGGQGVSANKIMGVLEEYFGAGEIVVLRSDLVSSRFSKNLTDQAGMLMGLTLLLILAYASIRFKPQYAVGAVIGIIHDALIMVGFVVWSGMEFNTSTIAAILTILGYSINNTIVIYDRIRENRRIYPDGVFVDVLNRSITGTLSRTIITTLTTMLAVLFLFVFATGSMKDFALALMVGMISGVYTTTFIASGFVNLWETRKIKLEKRKLSGAVSKA
jgi:preprotein translocase subunit SecF